MGFYGEEDFSAKLIEKIREEAPHLEEILGRVEALAVSSALNGFGSVLLAKDGYTGHHVHRTHFYTKLLLTKDNSLGLSDSQKEIVLLAARQHDLGKIEIEDKHLKGDYNYTKKEFSKIFWGHPERSAQVLHNALKPFLKSYGVLSILVLFHHYNYNSGKTGEGYPHIDNIRDDDLRAYVTNELYHGKYKGFLSEKEHPDDLDKNFYRVGIGVLRVVDSIDAATVIRKYKPGRRYKSMESIIEEIVSNSKEEYHPDVVTALANIKDLMIDKECATMANHLIMKAQIKEEDGAQKTIESLNEGEIRELKESWPTDESEIKEGLVEKGLLRKKTQNLTGVVRTDGWDLTDLGENVLREIRAENKTQI